MPLCRSLHLIQGLLALLLLLAPVCGVAVAGDHAASFDAQRVAHAGGAVGRRTYTNSFEAMEQSLQRGLRYLELDFVFTRDDHLVCLHDWEVNFERSFGYSVEQALSLAEFEAAVLTNPRFTNCTLSSLAEWMAERPQVVIVTDIRGDMREALRLIRGALPDARERVIPQIYQPRDISLVRLLGFKSLIWTLYRYGGSDGEVLRIVSSWGIPFAIAMPRQRARPGGLPASLARAGIPSYVHTVNSAEELDSLQELGITEIYTQFLYPDALPEAP